MRNKKKKRQLYHRILLIISVLSVLSMPVLAKESKRVDRGGYWVDSDVFVTEYTIPAVCCKDGEFIDIDGNRREFSEGKCKEGESCILYMSDNGTKETGDDIVLYID